MLVEDDSNDVNDQDNEIKSAEDINIEKHTIGSVRSKNANAYDVEIIAVELLDKLVQKVKENDDKCVSTKKSDTSSDDSDNSIE